MRMQSLARGILAAVAGGLLALFAMCASVKAQSAAVALSSAPAARIWFYRDLNPNESLATPYIRIDGAVAGVSEPGGAFYRDVPPGRYRLSADSYVNDKNQTVDVDAVPAREIFVKVVPNDDYVEGGGEHSGGYHRNSYVLWLYPPEAARPAIAHLRLEASGPLAAVPPR